MTAREGAYPACVAQGRPGRRPEETGFDVPVPPEARDAGPDRPGAHVAPSTLEVLRHSDVAAMGGHGDRGQARRAVSYERAGLRPAPGRWAALSAPLADVRKCPSFGPLFGMVWRRRQDLTLRLASSRTARSGFKVELEAPSGFEPENGGFADLCLTTWLRRPVGKDHQTARLWKGESGAGNGIRTRDFDLGKVALYH